MDSSSEPLDDANNESDAHESFVRLFSRERRRIYAFTYSLVPVTADAEDIFQQVSIVLWRKFAEFDRDRDFFKWACGVVFLTVQNFRRASARKRLIFSDELVQRLADQRLDWSQNENERMEALDECLSLLKTGDRKMIAEVYSEGSKPNEVAASLGLTVQTIYNRLTTIRKRLLECVNRKMSRHTLASKG